MDASRPWAIIVYAGIYVGHWVFFGLLAVLFQAKKWLVAKVKAPPRKFRDH